MFRSLRGREVPWLAASIATLVSLRLWLMASLPLADKTEARYGELARVTAEGGFWLMPHMTPTEPFFAKPPLSTWLAAASWTALGPSEFALRLPSFLLAGMTAWFVLVTARDVGVGRAGRWMAAAMLATAPMFLMSAGAVMTDAAHVAVVSGAMLASWRALRRPDAARWRLLFWATLGLATLAKGLATLALIGLPIVAFMACGGGFFRVVRRLWDPRGLALAAAICLAWYVPAERAYPGFLRYFLVGEHLQRFLEPSWAGDRYGRAHATLPGMIWLFWIAGIGTWASVFLAEAWRVARRLRARAAVSPDERWLWCWVLAPLVFFSLSRNIIFTYTLTAIPPFAVIVGRWAEARPGVLRRLAPGCVAGLAIAAVAFGTTRLPRAIDAISARQLVATAQAVNPDAAIVVTGCYPFSSDFYTRGTAMHVDDPVALANVLRQPGTMLVIHEPLVGTLLDACGLKELARNRRAVLLEAAPAEVSARDPAGDR